MADQHEVRIVEITQRAKTVRVAILVAGASLHAIAGMVGAYVYYLGR